MFCNGCNQRFPGQCTCPDRDARVEQLRKAPNVALRICKKCDKHADLCKCPQPKIELQVPPRWLHCPACGAEWTFPCSRSMVDCNCPCPSEEGKAPETGPWTITEKVGA